jgi:hypothetical protein
LTQGTDGKNDEKNTIPDIGGFVADLKNGAAMIA